MAYQAYGHPPQRHPSHASSSGYHGSPSAGGYSSGAGSSVHRASSTASSHYGPPNTSARPPRSQSDGRRPCPAGVDPTHWRWFNTVDVDGSGHITPRELQQALVNGDQSKFESETIKLLFGMFDIDRSGTIGIHEFVSIFKYVESWQAIFRRFDADRSGTIDASELSRALGEFQYNLSPHLIDLLCKKYSPLPSGPALQVPGITFDRFVRCCVSIKTLTDAFMEVDTDRDGFATISYDQFLSMVLAAP